MAITVLNRVGFFMALAAFGIAYAMRLRWGWLSDGVVLGVAAGVCVGLDLFWRVGKGKRKWFRSANGGSILYMPVWLLGLVWMGLCAYQTFVGPIPAMAKASSQMTWTISAPAEGQGQVGPEKAESGKQ
jgi:hypothetical protein